MKGSDPTSNLLSNDVSFTTAEVTGFHYEVVKVFLIHSKEQRSSPGVMKDPLKIKSEAG